jgi:hypothetical protein
MNSQQFEKLYAAINVLGGVCNHPDHFQSNIDKVAEAHNLIRDAMTGSPEVSIAMAADAVGFDIDSFWNKK